jgi:predicted anti-sigma-YlaC factor YlaD
MGLIVTVIGMAVIFLSAIGYLIFGNAVAGIIGIIFVALIAYFLRRGWNATDQQSRQLAAFTPFIIGWIIMILDGTALNFDLGVLLGGLLLVIGGAVLISNK